jgi:hypothetical protein
MVGLGWAELLVLLSLGGAGIVVFAAIIGVVVFVVVRARAARGRSPREEALRAEVERLRTEVDRLTDPRAAAPPPPSDPTGVQKPQ